MSQNCVRVELHGYQGSLQCMNTRKSLLAAVMTVPLFLAACGSDDEASNDASKASSSASSSASGSSSSSAKPSESASDSAKPEESAPADPAADPQNPEANPADPAAAGAPGIETPEPRVPAGGTASGDDTQAITNLVKGMEGSGDSVGGFLTYTVDHSCRAYKDKYGGDEVLRQQANEAKQMTFSQIGGAAPKIQSVNNVRVNGDSGTADVVGAEGPQTMNFQREDGNWTFCN